MACAPRYATGWADLPACAPPLVAGWICRHTPLCRANLHNKPLLGKELPWFELTYGGLVQNSHGTPFPSTIHAKSPPSATLALSFRCFYAPVDANPPENQQKTRFAPLTNRLFLV